MTLTQDAPQNLADALRLYHQSFTQKSPDKALANLKTTLKKMILPGAGFSPKSLTQIETCFAKYSIKLFVREAKSIYFSAEEKALNEGQNPGTLKNYRSHFQRFLKWIKSQDWYLEVVQPLEIPKYAPPLRKAGVTLAQLHKGRKHSGENPYSLKSSELTPLLSQQLRQLKSYLTSGWIRAQKGDRPINEISWDGYKKSILRFLGWLKNEINFALDELDITQMADFDLLNDYINWQLTDKGNGYRHAQHIGTAALNVAKWQLSQNSKSSGYHDCPQVLEIRALIRRVSAQLPTDRRTTSPESLAEKLLDLRQCQEIVEFLRCCCAERTADGNKRPVHAVVDSWQDYLIAAILTYTPVRQREIRELELSKNLWRDDDGWWVRLRPQDHKNGRKTGKGREYPLFSCHLNSHYLKVSIFCCFDTVLKAQSVNRNIYPSFTFYKN